MTQHQCCAALLRAKYIPNCTVLLCKTGSQQTSCHCNYTYEDLLLIQVCSDPPPMHCSTGVGKMHYTLSSAALQSRLTTGLCHCNHAYEDLLLMKVCSDPPPMHCSTCLGKRHFPLSSAALQTGSQHACVTAITPMKLCCSYKCAVTQHQCTAALVWAKCPIRCSVLLCKTGSQLACVTATTPMKVCCSYKCAVT